MDGMGWDGMEDGYGRWNWIGYTGTGTVPTNTSRPGSGSGSVWAKELVLACTYTDTCMDMDIRSRLWRYGRIDRYGC